MNTLVLLRHGESVWNLENRFTGWTDVDLSEKGINEAKNAGKLLAENDIRFDIAFTSYLKRAQSTLSLVLDELGQSDIPTVRTWKLNERHYGALQGLNKSETAEKYGDEQVHLWRRSYDVRPPALAYDDERNPVFDKKYSDIDRKLMPLAESLEDTVARVVPYYRSEIEPQLLQGKNVIIAAHGNSLRALVMYLEKLDKISIMNLNIPTATPIVYRFADTEIKKVSLEKSEADILV